MARWFHDRCPERGIPAVGLRRLLPGASFLGCRDLQVSGCSGDSRRVEPGEVFVAIDSGAGDLRAEVGRALARGAAAVVAEQPFCEAGRPQVIVPNARAALARIAHALAGSPSEARPTIVVASATPASAVAVATFLRAIFAADGERAALVGPEGSGDEAEADRPGPPIDGPEALAGVLAAVRDRGASVVIVALGPEALLGRWADGLTPAAVVIADTGPEAPALRSAQARLARRVRPGGLVVLNADDPDAALLAASSLDAEVVTFGLATADATFLSAVDGLDARGSRARLIGPDGVTSVEIHSLGRLAISAALAAAATARAGGRSADAVRAGLESVLRLPGRLEPTRSGACPVFRDRSRTGAELASALAALRESGFSRVVCHLGADPGADAPGLVAAAEAGADQVALAPASAGSDASLDAWLALFRRPGRVRITADARPLARPGDALVVVGAAPPQPSARDEPVPARRTA